MKTYTFTHTLADGTKQTFTIEANNATEALSIYRARVNESK